MSAQRSPEEHTSPPRTPASAAGEVAAHPRLPAGPEERFTGFGVMGLAFASGHYLALRVWTATSIGAPYRAVWHRDPSGRWHMFTTAPADRSCPRYFSSAASHERVDGIELDWSGDARLRIRIPGVVDWGVTMRSTPATRTLSALAGTMPESARRSDALLGAMGPMSRPMLRAGRMRMVGATPNRQHFQVMPLSMWRVAESTAVFAGTDLGPAGALSEQSRLGEFWMPQRGVFYVGEARFESFDPTRHASADAPVAVG